MQQGREFLFFDGFQGSQYGFAGAATDRASYFNAGDLLAGIGFEWPDRHITALLKIKKYIQSGE
jgi:hypothetical protein